MAQLCAGEFDISYLTQCSICTKVLKTPKCLPCTHTFCLECLRQRGKNAQPGDEIACPLCRKMFRIPAGGFEKLSRNFFVDQILSSSQCFRTGSATSGVKCELCDQNDARRYCVDCPLSICDTCLVPHGKLKDTHKVLPLSEKEGSDAYAKARPTYCDIHQEEQLTLYCNNCEKAVCRMCSVQSHSTHLREDIQEKSQKFDESLTDILVKLKQFNIKNSELQEALHSKEEKLTKEVSTCEQAIVERGAELKRIVDAECSQLFEQLTSVKNERLNKVHAEMNDIEKHLTDVKNCEAYIEQLTGKGSTCAITQSATWMFDRMSELRKFHERFKDCGSTEHISLLSASAREEVQSGRMKLIGSIETSESVLMVVGLTAGFAVVPDVLHISLERPGSVRKIGSTPTSVSREAAACVMGNTLYAVGIGEAHNELWKWNETSNWLKCEDMMSRRRRHSVAVVDSTLYVLGGWMDAGGITLNGVEAYNTQTNKWSVAGQLMNAVWGAACVTYKGAIYVIGGAQGLDSIHTHIQVYNPAHHSCIFLRDSMSQDIRNASEHCMNVMRAVLWETSAILICWDTCLIYDFEAQKWQKRAAFKTGIAHFGLILDKETLYIAGGGKSKRDEENKLVWTLTDEVRSVSVRDVIEDKQGASWKHHANLTMSSLVQCFNSTPLELSSRT